jgi:hypothetical protein
LFFADDCSWFAGLPFSNDRKLDGRRKMLQNKRNGAVTTKSNFIGLVFKKLRFNKSL